MKSHDPERRTVFRRTEDKREHSGQFRRLAAYTILALAGAFGLWKVDSAADDARHAAADAQVAVGQAREATEQVEQESNSQTIKLCENTNEGRKLLLGLIESQTAGTDFTKIPGFEGLDLETQAFLRNLTAASQDDEPSDFQILARQTLTQQDCQAIASGGNGD